MHGIGKPRQGMSGFLQVKTRLFLAAALLAGACAARAQEPDAREILRSVRQGQAAQHHTLTGRLRTGSKAIPFRLVIDGSSIRYEFTNPPQAIVLRLGEKDARLTEVTPEGTEKVGGAKYDDRVRDTDISYEDLSMRFLYWPSARVEGEQTVTLRRCWIVRVEPGAAGSQYGSVKLWIDKENGALMQAEAYDRAGQFARRFKVVSGQKIGGAWYLKQMRIEAPGGQSKDRTPTYLEVQGVEK
jgi:outer membrane lipoprotein-sorting protein